MATAGEGPGEKVFSGRRGRRIALSVEASFSRSNPAAPPAQQQLRQIRGRWKNRRRRWWRAQGGRTRLNTCRSTRQFERAKTRDNYLRKQED
jgi:hypothetical protein